MKLQRVCAIALPVIALGAVALWPRSAKVHSSRTPAAETSHAPGSAAQTGPVEFIELHASVEQGLVKAEFRGNGREKLRALLTNTGNAPLKVQADAGQTFESGTNAVVVVRSTMIEVPPGKTEELLLQTCATRSANKLIEMPYKLSYVKAEKLQPLLAYAAEHLELSPGAVQTAALAVTENLPLSAVAKFPAASAELKSRFNTDAFRVETIDLIAALTALRAIDIPDEAVAMTIDPQLKIEAMIEPLSRVAAMQYYGITPENEWEFWKSELLFGEPATRHYALYGIARFYPDIALDMLPKWAREPKTKNVYRISAMQALADTQRPDALPILRELADELGSETELGRAARGAAEFLDQRLNQVALKQNAVAFRASKTISQF